MELRAHHVARARRPRRMSRRASQVAIVSAVDRRGVAVHEIGLRASSSPRSKRIVARALQPVPAHVRHAHAGGRPAGARTRARAAGPGIRCRPLPNPRTAAACRGRCRATAGVSARHQRRSRPFSRSRAIAVRRRADAGQDHVRGRADRVAQSRGHRRVHAQARRRRARTEPIWRRPNRAAPRAASPRPGRAASITARPWCSAARCPRAGSPAAARAPRP